MSEVYEIGVSLALSDGVSEGIERARRDMAQFERVLTESGVSVARLRAEGAIAITPSRPGMAAEKPAKVASSASDNAGIEQAKTFDMFCGPDQRGIKAYPDSVPAMRPQTDAAIIPDRASEVSVQPGGGEPRVSSAPVPNTTVQTLPVTDDRGDQDVLTAIGVAGQDIALAQTIIAPVAASDPNPSCRMPAVTRLSQAATGLPDETVLRGAADNGHGLSLMQSARQAAAPAARTFSNEHLEHSEAERRTETNQPSGWEAPWQAVEPAAPQTRAAKPAYGAAGRVAETPESVSRSVSEHGSQSRGPTEGDVHLDGMLVGRWISRFLANEAGRASAGPTAFDPRRGRLLPGPTVGG